MQLNVPHSSRTSQIQTVPLPAFHCLILEILGKTSHISKRYLENQGQKVTVKSEDTHLPLLGFRSILGFTGHQGTRVLGRALRPGRFRALQFQFSYCINKSVP